MKPTNALMLLLVGFCLLGAPMANEGLCSDPQIQWSEDLSETMELARQTGKPVLVHFYGDHCPPCRMLEKKAFKDRQLIEAISDNLLAVKINAERDTKTAARFRVNRWPTDVYLFSDGQEIYRNISAQDPTAYEKTVLKVAEKNKRMLADQRPKRPDPTRAQLMAMQTPAPAQAPEPIPSTPQSDQAMSQMAPVNATLAKATRIRLNESLAQGVDVADVKSEKPSGVTLPASALTGENQPVVVEVPAQAPALQPAPPAPKQPAPIDASLPTSVAMNGFCPVSLGAAIAASQSGAEAPAAWVKGKPEFAVRHRGRIYHCVSQDALAKFLENPDQFAPVLSGCDLVEYSKSGKWIDGDCRFGFIDKETGRIFLFSSSLNCQEFAQNCESYSSMVGKPTGR